MPLITVFFFRSNLKANTRDFLKIKSQSLESYDVYAVA